MSHQEQVEELLRDAIKPIKEAIAKRDLALNSMVSELERLKRDAARYRVVRRLKKREFAALVDDCLYRDLRFDDEVDRIGGLK